MRLFSEIKEPRSILFGMKLNKSESQWLQSRAAKEGLSKSSLVRKLLAELVKKEAESVRRERG